MSIHHEVTVHCDTCGHWQHGNESTTRRRRKDGWRIWREFGDAGPWRHVCPRCSAQGEEAVKGRLDELGMLPDDYPADDPDAPAPDKTSAPPWRVEHTQGW